MRKPDRRLEAFISSTWAFGATRTKSYHTKGELLLPEGRTRVSSALKTMVDIERAGFGEVMGGSSDSTYL